jgi:hypothetical protein
VSVDPLNQTKLVPRLPTIREDAVAIISELCHIKPWRLNAIRCVYPVSDHNSVDVRSYLRQRACIRFGP